MPSVDFCVADEAPFLHVLLLARLLGCDLSTKKTAEYTPTGHKLFIRDEKW